jgi:hypothetical protein
MVRGKAAAIVLDEAEKRELTALMAELAPHSV